MITSAAQRVRGGWFGGPRAVLGETFLSLLESHAREHPSALALSTETESVSYASLVDQVHDVASRLDVAEGDVVAVRMTDSAAAMVLLLGAARAGATCLALDPQLPPEREAAILAQAEPVTILEIGCVLAARRPAVPSMPTGQQAAYLVFTSGTTGVPKGVLVNHGGLHDTAVHSAEWFGLKRGDRLLCSANWTFDASWWELAVALSVGATVVRCPLEQVPKRLREVDAALMTPSVANWAAPAVNGLDCFGLAGEAPNSPLVDQLAAGAKRVLNLYGPAEASICVAIGALVPGGRIDVGQPLPGTYAYVLNENLEPSAEGTVGQLYVAGRCVGGGYLKDPEQTAQKFVPDVFRPGEVMYATGDLASFDLNGRLTVHGRVDSQLKIRGVRIEPEEIRTVIRAVDGVLDVAVSPLEVDGRTALGALIVPQDPDAWASIVDTVKQVCRARLQDAMVPVLWHWIAALPLSIGGKLDQVAVRDALSIASEGSAAVVAAPYEHLSEFQRFVVSALPQQDIELGKRLLDQGLDSLGAVRLAAELNDAFGTGLRGADVMASQSVFELEETAQRTVQLPNSREATLSMRPSPGESRLYHLWRADRASVSYNVPFNLDFRGKVENQRLADAVRHVLGAHDELHVRFVEDPDLRVERNEPFIEIQCRDLVNAQLSEDRADEIVQELARVPFELDKGSLVRVALLELSPNFSRLVIVAHHVVIDGASALILARQIFETYVHGPAEVRGGGSGYREYAHRANLRDEQDELRLRAAWSKYLRGAPDVLFLPFTGAPKTVGPVPSMNVSQALSSELGRKLDATARRSGCTLFHVILTAFGELLSSWAGTSDSLVATLTSQRPTVGDEETVGFFIETLPVRVPRMRGSVEDSVRTVRDASIEAMTISSLPFEDIVSEVSPSRVPGRIPLAQAAINMFSLPGEWVSADREITASLAFPLARDSKFDVLLYVHPKDDGIDLRWAFRADMFEPELIEEFTQQFRALLFSISAPSAQQIGRTDSPPSVAGANRASRSSKDSSRTITGAVLDSRGRVFDVEATATSLVKSLREKGVGARALVAIRAERVPLLAAVLAGLHQQRLPWVLLDPSWPEPLVDEILTRLRPAVVVSLSPELRISELEGKCAEFPAGTGYVAPTSGTTGAPKYVLGVGRAIDLQVRWHQDLMRGIPIRAVMSSGLTYDPLLRDIFVPLLSGGELVVPDVEPAREPMKFLSLLSAQKVTLLHTTPGVLAALADAGHEPVESMRLVLLGGEAVSDADFRSAHGLFPRARLFNVYGATETPQIASAFEWTTGLQRPRPTIPVGRGRGDSRLIVVDEEGRCCPPGVLGEVAVESDHLAGGYWGPGDEVLPLPAGGCPGRYLTGDLGRFDLAGDVHLAGRRDHQVKVAGARIELSAIEAIASSVPGVQRVTVRPGSADRGAGLVAIIQPHHDSDPFLVGQLVQGALAARWASSELPHVITVRKPALTETGKIDFRATLESSHMEVVAPDWTPIERDLAEIWADVLGTTPDRPTVSFFHIGGNSLTALRMLRRIEERFGIAIPVTGFFVSPTPRLLASLIEQEALRALLDESLDEWLDL